MRTPKKLALGVVLVMAASMVLSLVATIPASAGTVLTPNGCRNSAVPTDWTQVDVTFNGTSPATVNPGQSFTLSGISQTLALPGALFVAGYNLGLLSVGVNNVPGTVKDTIVGSNTVEGSQDTNTVNVSVTFTISDPDGTPGTGDETATDATVSNPFNDQTWTAGASGTINFAESSAVEPPTATTGAIVISASLAGGLLVIHFGCSPGTVVGSSPGVFTPGTGLPFSSTSIVNPPTAPVCTDESDSVGVTQTIPIDLNNNCTDVNGNIDNTTFTLTAPSSGTLTPTGNGTWNYTAPAVDPGAPIVLDFTVTDTTALTSNVAHVSITILANQCDATSAPCSLNEIIVQPVVGTTLTMSKVPGVVLMSTIVLNGQPQVSGGLLQELTVINARGTGNSWSVTGYATDLGDGTAGMPSGTVPPGITIPMCSLAGSLGGVLGPSVANRHCIPGDNLMWQPSAAVAHALIPGDVAQVTAGPSMAANATDWLNMLIAGYPNLNGTNPNGLGGLGELNLLCTAPTDHSGGTFHCDAGLALGVPASAAAGTFTGGLVLTLA